MARGIKIGGGTSIISGGDATASDILLNKTAFVDGLEVIGSIITAAGKTITPTTSAQTESSAGKYYSGDIIVGAIPNQQNGGAWTPSTSAQDMVAANKYLKTDVTVNAIPNQQNGGAWTPSTSAQTMVAANKYLKTAVTVNAIPNQQNGGSWTPSTSAQTMVSANKYLKTAVTVNAIPNQTAGGAKYATTSAQTILAANKWLTSALTIGALSQSNLAAANIVRGKTITISNGSTNVWSVAGSNNALKMVSGSATGSSGPNYKAFTFDTSSTFNDMRYISINPGFTPVYAFSLAHGEGNRIIWAWRSGQYAWNYKFQDYFFKEGYINNSSYNTAYRWTSSAVDLPAASWNAVTTYYWIFGY